ncbi:hypothetical protein N311_04625, partial [Apaloderma vittatum]
PVSSSADVPSAIVVAANAREVTAPRVEGHALTAQDAANSSRSGGAH